MIGERVMPEGEPDVVTPPGVVRGGEVQSDRDERTDVLHADGLDMDVGDDGGLIVVVRRSNATDEGRGRRRQRRLDQGCRGAGFLGEDGSRALLLLRERGGGKDSDMGGVVLLLRFGGGGDHGVKFLPKLGGLDSLAGVVGSHQRWCCGAQGGGTGHRRCSERREDGRPLGFERSGSKKNLGSDYHVGESCAVKY
jgi:hypothetical protein